MWLLQIDNCCMKLLFGQFPQILVLFVRFSMWRVELVREIELCWENSVLLLHPLRLHLFAEFCLCTSHAVESWLIRSWIHGRALVFFNCFEVSAHSLHCVVFREIIVHYCYFGRFRPLACALNTHYQFIWEYALHLFFFCLVIFIVREDSFWVDLLVFWIFFEIVCKHLSSLHLYRLLLIYLKLFKIKLLTQSNILL